LDRKGSDKEKRYSGQPDPGF